MVWYEIHSPQEHPCPPCGCGLSFLSVLHHFGFGFFLVRRYWFRIIFVGAGKQSGRAPRLVISGTCLNLSGPTGPRQPNPACGKGGNYPYHPRCVRQVNKVSK
jgi:hypothetical protein